MRYERIIAVDSSHWSTPMRTNIVIDDELMERALVPLGVSDEAESS